MKIEQIYTKCLAQGAYYIYSNGEAAVIDPLRDIQPYIELAKKDNATIKYIFETHFHADFVSGHLSLVEKIGADIIYGPNANPEFPAYIAKDNEEFKLGSLTIKVLHTPGHTMESTTYLLIDEKGKEHAIFTGDTLFLGDVGRPDLAQKSEQFTMQDLAGYAFDSLRTKIMPLPNNVIVYPGHGAGSACGKNMMKETVDTLGHQKEVNYALRADMTKEEFVAEVTAGLLAPPSYFPHNVKMNKKGYEDLDTILSKSLNALTVSEFELISKSEKQPLILDVRSPQDFALEHIPNSLFIGLDGGFAPWAGEIISNTNRFILLVTPKGREQETITRLSRVGIDNVLGYLEDGIVTWKKENKPTDSITSITASEFETIYNSENRGGIFDVRKETEYVSNHVKEAINTPLSHLDDYLLEFPKDKPFYIHCAGGYRSIIAASILKSKGVHNIIDIQKGYSDIKKTQIPRVETSCSAA